MTTMPEDPLTLDVLPVPDLADPDDAYANAPHIPDSDAFLTRWPARAAAFRAEAARGARPPATIAYGGDPRETLELYFPTGGPSGASLGLAIIVHGGYWHRFDRRTFSHLAGGALARGWAVAVPEYPLCPDVGIDAITRSIGAAIACAHHEATASGELAGAAPIRLAGHSAGGHLVTRQLCTDSPLAPAIRSRVDRVLSISGVHDLVPLLATTMNGTLGLSLDTALAESPARREPLGGARVLAWVGAAERPEFIRQNALLGDLWSRHGLPVDTFVEPGRHHFDVIEDLERADSPMLERWLGA